MVIPRSANRRLALSMYALTARLNEAVDRSSRAGIIRIIRSKLKMDGCSYDRMILLRPETISSHSWTVSFPSSWSGIPVRNTGWADLGSLGMVKVPRVAIRFLRGILGRQSRNLLKIPLVEATEQKGEAEQRQEGRVQLPGWKGGQKEGVNVTV